MPRMSDRAQTAAPAIPVVPPAWGGWGASGSELQDCDQRIDGDERESWNSSDYGLDQIDLVSFIAKLHPPPPHGPAPP